MSEGKKGLLYVGIGTVSTIPVGPSQQTVIPKYVAQFAKFTTHVALLLDSKPLFLLFSYEVDGCSKMRNTCEVRENGTLVLYGRKYSFALVLQRLYHINLDVWRWVSFPLQTPTDPRGTSDPTRASVLSISLCDLSFVGKPRGPTAETCTRHSIQHNEAYIDRRQA